MSTEQDSQLVLTQIQEVLERRGARLRFPKELERQFEADRRAARARRQGREGLITILIFAAFCVTQWLTQGATSREIELQMGVILPLSLVVNWFVFRAPPRRVREAAIAAMTCVIAWTYLPLQYGKSPVAVVLALVGIMVIAMFASVVMRLRFPFALGTSALIALAGMLFLANERSLTVQDKVSGAVLMTVAISIAMMSNYSLEREERVGYLLFRESQTQRELLAEMNLRLERRSMQDRVTGLPNRWAYEERFEQMWRAAVQGSESIAIVVVDIDHFKMLNDLFGHVYGDQVLHRIGSLLPQALRGPADFVGRFGGEEFVILLPETERESAVRVAERIRTLIELAASPQQTRPVAGECLMWVTASCGVSACVPVAGQQRETLLETADRAMYAAKSNGRNRVSYLGMEDKPERSDTRIAITGHVA